LAQINNVTHQYSNLIPDLWEDIPALKTTPGTTWLLFANQSGVFFRTFAYGPVEGRARDLGFYKYDLQSSRLDKLSYHPGKFETMSPDDAYIADAYLVATSTDEIIVFSLNDNKNVYDSIVTITPSQTLCSNLDWLHCDSFTWDGTSTVSYAIYDESKKVPVGQEYPVVQKKSIVIPLVSAANF